MTERKRKKTKKKEESPKLGEVKQETQVNESTIFVGKKPIMNYITACLTRFNSGSERIIVKARGRAICRAVDTAELLRRSFLKDLELQNIRIFTEEVAREEGRKTNVSSIEITLSK